MSRTPRNRPTGATAVLGALIGALTLAGCGAGQVTQTAEQVSAVGGANAGTGTVVIRNAEIAFGDEAGGGYVYRAGGAAPLHMSIVNTGTTADRLLSASSPAAASVQVSGDVEVPAGRSLTVEGEPAQVAPATSTAGPTAAGSTARPTATTAPTATPSAQGTRGAQIVLTGLSEDVRAGLTYPVVLTFERAGDIYVNVPVANTTEPRKDEPAE